MEKRYWVIYREVRKVEKVREGREGSDYIVRIDVREKRGGREKDWGDVGGEGNKKSKDVRCVK